MKLVTINRNPSPRALRLFAGLWFPASCAVIGLAVRAGIESWRAALVIWCGGALLSALALLFPRANRLLYLFWIYLTFPIGLVVSYTLFTVAYYGILTPAGLLMKILGYDPLRLKKKQRDADSNWAARGPSPDRSRYFQQY
jgi:hypothetical protein